MRRVHLLVLTLIAFPLFASAATLRNGPMLGYATMAEALIWVQTDAPAEVKVAYWPLGQPEAISFTDAVRTEKPTAFVAKCLADQVRAGTTYGYAVLIDGERVEPRYREGYAEEAIPLTFHTPPNWRFREQGHVPFDFTIGFGSCAYINEREGGYDRLNSSSPYGADYQIFEAVHEVDPDVFIWLGDNIYYREPDWSSRTGMIHRWTHDRSIPELRPMLATIPQYATWDDHDYGPNDAGRDYWLKETATEIFTLFNGNPSAGLPEIPGIFTYFAWGDVHFYLLDNRTHRTPPALHPNAFGYQAQQLGKAQIDWLVEAMTYHRDQSVSSYPSTFHVVALGSQVLSPYSGDGLQRYPGEWQYLIDRLVTEELHNVIFITGDVHFSEVSRLTYTGGGRSGVPGKAGEAGKEYVFWEVTSSPMTAGPWPGSPPEGNPYRVDVFPGEADRYGQRNFATLTFEGSLTERRAVIRYYDSNGKLINQDPDADPGIPMPESIIPSRELNLSRSLYR